MDPTSAWILAGTLTMLWYGIWNLVMKFPLSQVWVWRTLFWRCGIQLVLITFFAFLYLSSHEMVIAPRYWLYAAGAALCWFLPFVTFLKALERGKVSIVVSVANSSLLFTAMFSWLFLGEYLDVRWWSMVLMIVCGLMMLSLSFDDLRGSDMFSLSSGVPHALFSSFGRWFSFVLFSMLVPKIGRVMMTVIISLVNFASSVVMMKWHTQAFALPSWWSTKYILITAVWAVIGTASFNRWVSVSSTNLVAAIWFSWPLVVVVWSYFLYQERLSVQQYIGILIVVASIVWYSLNA